MKGVLVTFLFLIFVVLLSSCAPVKFTAPQASEGSQFENPQELVLNKEKTILEKYLDGEIDKDFVLAYLFSDIENFRLKIYDFSKEIQSYSTLSIDQHNKILVLEYDLNKSISVFNSKSIFSRTFEIASSAIEKNERKNNFSLSTSPESTKKLGLSPHAISDSNVGVLNSIIKNGFMIEEVDFFCLENCR